MSSNCGVYCIRCKVNNKAYIGSSANIKKRLSNHKSSLKAGKHINKQLQEDYNKYGADSFLYLVLINCKSSELHRYEYIYMEMFSTRDKAIGYNIAPVSNVSIIQILPKPDKEATNKPREVNNGIRYCSMKEIQKAPPRMQQRIQCVETGEILTKYEVSNKGKNYGNLKLHLLGIAENYKGYHWRYVYRR